MCSNLVAKEYVPVGNKGFYYTEEFCLSSSVSCLGIIQLPAVECNGLVVLGNDSELIVASIGVGRERLREVRIR